MYNLKYHVVRLACYGTLAVLVAGAASTNARKLKEKLKFGPLQNRGNPYTTVEIVSGYGWLMSGWHNISPTSVGWYYQKL